jgi:MGT family glycosyltransferase
LQPDIPVHSETWPWKTDRFSLLRNSLMQRLLVTVARSFWVPIRDAETAKGRRWNIWRHLNEIPPSLAQVAQLPACLDFPRRHAPDHFHHTGPWHEPKAAREDDFDWSWLDGRPLVYASLGTLQNGLDHLYQIILDAGADLPMQIVLTLGRDNGTMPERIPANAKVLGFGPQLALLKRASIVITHAGLNTALESLAQGLPMVALPIANEQPGIASRIRHAGVGEWLAIRGLTPRKLRAMVQHVHNEPRYRNRSRACAESLARDHGLQRAAQIIEDALLNRRRVVKV